MLALAAARRSPLVALALLGHQRLANPAGTAGSTRLRRWVVGLTVARLLAPAALVPLTLAGSLVGVLGVVLALAGGITVAARVTGLG